MACISTSRMDLKTRPAALAVQNGHIIVAEELIMHNADVDAQTVHCL